MKAKSSAKAKQKRILRNRLLGTQALEQRKLLAGDLFSGFFSVADFTGSQAPSTAEESFFRDAVAIPNAASANDSDFLEFIVMDSEDGESLPEGVEVVEFDADLSPEEMAELLGFAPTEVVPATMVGEWDESEGWFEFAINSGDDTTGELPIEILDFDTSELEGIEWNTVEADDGSSFELPSEIALLGEASSVELVDLSEEELADLFGNATEVAANAAFMFDVGEWDANGDPADWIEFGDDAIEVEYELDPSTAAQMELASLDVNGDGSATAEEIATSYVEMYGLREEAASGAAQAMLDKFDANDDAALDASELIVSYNRDLAQAELEQLDQDEDGLASKEELTQSYLELYGLREAAAEGAAQGMLDAFDTDENGGLDLDELTASYPTEIVVDPGTPIDSPEEDPAELAASVFASLDADEDGEATRAEITESFVALGLDESTADEAAGEMLSLFDSDESGSISLNEVITAIESGNGGIVMNDVDGADLEAAKYGEEAIELDLPADATPEQIAEALGVSVEEIEFIDFDVTDEIELDELLEEANLDSTESVDTFAANLGEVAAIPAVVSNDLMIDFENTDASSPRAFSLQVAADELAEMMSGSKDDVIIMGDHACHFFTPESMPTDSDSAEPGASSQVDAFFDVDDEEENVWQFADLEAMLLSIKA
ncbi:MAG: hypothetical protein ACE361_05555 [Aureliella sp.]